MQLLLYIQAITVQTHNYLFPTMQNLHWMNIHKGTSTSVLFTAHTISLRGSMLLSSMKHSLVTASSTCLYHIYIWYGRYGM